MLLRLSQIAVTLSLLSVASGYSYSCEEVKYQLANTDKQISAKYVCVVPVDKFSSFSVLELLSVQSDSDSFTFDVMANSTSPSFCKGSDISQNWKIIQSSEISCNQEFTLIFTSDPPLIGQATEYLDRRTANTSNRVTIVSPAAGMDIFPSHCDSASSTVTIYSGVGKSEAEGLFLLASWTCADAPEVLTVFESVITISAFDLVFQYTTHQTKTYISALKPIQVLASGRSGNVQNLNNQHCDAFFSWGRYEQLLIETDVTFDSQHPGTVEIHYYTVSGLQVQQFKTSGAELLYMKNAYSAEVYYFPATLPADQIGTIPEQIFVQISFSDAAPVTSTQTPESSTGEHCNCDVDTSLHPVGWNSTEIWLDVVIILDTSEAVGESALNDAVSLINSFIGFGDLTILNTNTSSEFFTRIGVISMADEAQVLYNLNMTKANQVRASTKKGVAEMDFAKAFTAAFAMLSDGVYRIPERTYARQVVYLLTDSNVNGDMEVVNQFKQYNGLVIVNNLKNADEADKPSLKKLASDGYYHSDIQKLYMRTIQLFCKANCFCEGEHLPYAGANPDIAIQAAGGCYSRQHSGIPYNRAVQNCAGTGNGIVATVHDDHKGGFLRDLMTDASSFFWIGYTKGDDGQWTWADNSTNAYTNWGAGEPSSAAVAKCAYADSSSLTWGAGNCQIGFTYACQYVPCSVGNKNCNQ